MTDDATMVAAASVLGTELADSDQTVPVRFPQHGARGGHSTPPGGARWPRVVSPSRGKAA